MKRKRILLVSGSIILVCLVIVAGVIYSLFTDQYTVGNHLVAGELDITLQRTHLEYCTLNADGKLAVVENKTLVDFSNKTENNVFGMNTRDIKITPGSYFQATLRILNDNSGNALHFSNVPFEYSVKVVFIKGGQNLAKQMQITITDNDGKSTTMMLSDLTDGQSFAVGTLEPGDGGHEFTVKVEFLDDVDYKELDNDRAQGESIVFDLVVTAVQADR